MQFITDYFFPKKIKVLMVCTANICRSPMAHAILKEMVKAKGLGSKVRVESAGTNVPVSGLLPDRRMMSVLLENGISTKKLKTRPFVPSDIEEFNYILVMDSKHLSFANYMSSKQEHIGLIMNYATNKTGTDVPDPYYGHPSEFKEVFNLLEDACSGFLEKISARHILDKAL